MILFPIRCDRGIGSLWMRFGNLARRTRAMKQALWAGLGHSCLWAKCLTEGLESTAARPLTELGQNAISDLSPFSETRRSKLRGWFVMRFMVLRGRGRFVCIWMKTAGTIGQKICNGERKRKTLMRRDFWNIADQGRGRIVQAKNIEPNQNNPPTPHETACIEVSSVGHRVINTERDDVHHQNPC